METKPNEQISRHGVIRHGWGMLLAGGCLIIAVGLTFSPVLRGQFVGVDDGNNIFLNPHMGVLSWGRLGDYFGNFTSARRYMPLGWLGYSAVFSWQGLDPMGYHAANLAWHALAAVALFLAAFNIFGLRADPVPAANLHRIGAAGLAAATWALHPLRTEAVAWASGLLYSQAEALAFLAVWLWTLRWSTPRRASWYTAGASLTLTMSLLTYPLALGLPVVCWLLDWAFGSRNAREEERSASLFRRFHLSGSLAVITGVAGAMLAVTLVSRQVGVETFASMPSLASFGWFERGVQALYVWTHYLVNFLFPINLAPVYTTLYSQHPFTVELYGTAGLGVVAILAAAVLARRHHGLVGWTVAYTAMALPVLGLTEHPWIPHDRYAGLLHPVLAIGGFYWLLGRASVRFYYYVAGLAVVAILAAAQSAHSLIGVWTDPWTYDARLEQTLPRNFWAGYYLGKVPASVLFLDGRFAEIDQILARAEAHAPGWSAGPVRAEFNDLIGKHREFLRKVWPSRTLAPLAVLHYLHGKSFQDQQDWQTARAHFQAAQRMDGHFAEAGLEEAWCELELNHPVAARQCLEQAITPPNSLADGAREQAFWCLLAAVHRARGELELETGTLQRAHERGALSARP